MSEFILAADVLDGGADLIDRNGLWQPDNYSQGKRDCALTAIKKSSDFLINNSADRLNIKNHAWNAMLIAVGANPHEDSINKIVAWNDAEGRTKEEVVSTMRACAVVLRAMESGAPEYLTTTERLLENTCRVIEKMEHALG